MREYRERQRRKLEEESGAGGARDASEESGEVADDVGSAEREDEP
jgi:hypothetical protein